MTNANENRRARQMGQTGTAWRSWALGAGLVLAAMTIASTASATESARKATLHMRVVADNVVVSPGNAPAPANNPPAQTVVVPQGTAPAAQAAPTVVEEPRKRTNVHVEARENPNYMSTIAVSALMGAVAGGLVGGAIYYLGDRNDAVHIAYWAAGGVLVGTGVGITQLMIQESRVSNATASRFPSDPAPTYRLALLNLKF